MRRAASVAKQVQPLQARRVEPLPARAVLSEQRTRSVAAARFARRSPPKNDCIKDTLMQRDATIIKKAD